MATPERFTADDKHACAERELKMRRHVYPRWIEGGRMKRAAAEREIALMESIRDDYAAKVAADPGPLFGMDVKDKSP